MHYSFLASRFFCRLEFHSISGNLHGVNMNPHLRFAYTVEFAFPTATQAHRVTGFDSTVDEFAVYRVLKQRGHLAQIRTNLRIGRTPKRVRIIEPFTRCDVTATHGRKTDVTLKKS